MPKLFGKNLEPIHMIGIAGIIGVLFMVLKPGEEETPAGAYQSRKSTKKAATKGDAYLPEDYEAKFTPVTDSIKNTFSPLVTRRGVGLSGDIGAFAEPNLISTDLTDGEASWVYTGMAIVDGVKQGLLENSSLQQGDFVTIGQRWKKATIRDITIEGIVMVGPDGKERSFKLGQTSSEQRPAGNVSSNTGVAPVNPGAALSGQIGAGIPGAPMTGLGAQPDIQVRPETRTREDRRQRRQQQLQQEGINLED